MYLDSDATNMPAQEEDKEVIKIDLENMSSDSGGSCESVDFESEQDSFKANS